MAWPDFSRIHPAAHSPSPVSASSPATGSYPQLPPSVAAQIAAIVRDAVPAPAAAAPLADTLGDVQTRLQRTEERLAASEQRLADLAYATRVQTIVVAAAACAVAGSVWLARRAP